MTALNDKLAVFLGGTSALRGAVDGLGCWRTRRLEAAYIRHLSYPARGGIKKVQAGCVVMAQYQHLPIYKQTYDILLRTMMATKEFPREYKYTLGQKNCPASCRLAPAIGLQPALSTECRHARGEGAYDAAAKIRRCTSCTRSKIWRLLRSSAFAMTSRIKGAAII